MKKSTKFQRLNNKNDKKDPKKFVKNNYDIEVQIAPDSL